MSTDDAYAFQRWHEPAARVSPAVPVITQEDRTMTTQTQRRPCPVCAGTAVVPGTRDLPCPTCAPGRLAAITPRAQEG